MLGILYFIKLVWGLELKLKDWIRDNTVTYDPLEEYKENLSKYMTYAFHFIFILWKGFIFIIICLTVYSILELSNMFVL